MKLDIRDNISFPFLKLLKLLKKSFYAAVKVAIVIIVHLTSKLFQTLRMKI